MPVDTLYIALKPGASLLDRNVWNGRTFAIQATGDISGTTALRAEIHSTRRLGQAPVQYEELSNPTIGPHNFEFSAGKMVLLPDTDAVERKVYYLAIMGRTGTGDDAVRTCYGLIRLNVLACPGSDLAATGETASPYLTRAEADALYATLAQLATLQAQVDALSGGVTGPTLLSIEPDADEYLTLVFSGLSFRVPHMPGSGSGAAGVVRLVSTTPDADDMLTLTYGAFAFRVEYTQGTGSGTSGVLQLTSTTPDPDDQYLTLTWGAFAFRLLYTPAL